MTTDACLVPMAHESASTAMPVLIAAVEKVMGIGCSRGHRMPSYDCATSDEHTAIHTGVVERASVLQLDNANDNIPIYK